MAAAARSDGQVQPPATQPAQQNGSPTWIVAGPEIATAQAAQVKGSIVLSGRIGFLWDGWETAGGVKGCAAPQQCDRRLDA